MSADAHERLFRGDASCRRSEILSPGDREDWVPLDRRSVQVPVEEAVIVIHSHDPVVVPPLGRVDRHTYLRHLEVQERGRCSHGILQTQR